MSTLESPDERRTDEVVAGFAATVMPPKTGVKHDLGAFLPLVTSYRIVLRSGVEIIRGRLRPEVDPTDPEIQSALTAGGRTVHMIGRGDAVELLMVRPDEVRARLWLHLILFAATAVSVLTAGALIGGVDPLGTRVFDVLGLGIPIPTEFDVGQLLTGWTFALPLLAVLGVHEGGHLWAARRHRVPASLPWFIPMPPYLSIIGTLGAFIRLRGPMVRRNILLDIGVWGPFAGFAVALPVFVAGMAMSSSGIGAVDAATPYVMRFVEQPIWLGASPLTAAVAALVGPDASVGPIALHPLAVAGWLGLFFTALNLLPIGQLDGGHILYALGRRAQRGAALLALGTLAILGLWWWGWWFWGGLVFVISGGRLAHPPLFQEEVPLTPGRRRLVYAAILLFFLTFVPVPLAL